jgi:hypothetical protein
MDTLTNFTNFTNFNILLSKIKEKLHDLELILDFDNNNTILQNKISLIKSNIDKALLTKDIKILDMIWNENFNNKNIQNDDIDFM